MWYMMFLLPPTLTIANYTHIKYDPLLKYNGDLQDDIIGQWNEVEKEIRCTMVNYIITRIFIGAINIHGICFYRTGPEIGL